MAVRNMRPTHITDEIICQVLTENERSGCNQQAAVRWRNKAAYKTKMAEVLPRPFLFQPARPAALSPFSLCTSRRQSE
jgi:hypothetical protein